MMSEFELGQLVYVGRLAEVEDCLREDLKQGWSGFTLEQLTPVLVMVQGAIYALRQLTPPVDETA